MIAITPFKKFTVVLACCCVFLGADIIGCQSNQKIPETSTTLVLPAPFVAPHTPNTDVSVPLNDASKSNASAITLNGEAGTSVAKANGEVATANGLSTQPNVKTKLDSATVELNTATAKLKQAIDKQIETDKLLSITSAKFDQLSTEHKLFIDNAMAVQTKLNNEILDGIEKQKAAQALYDKTLKEKEELATKTIKEKDQEITQLKKDATDIELAKKRNAAQQQQDWWVNSSHWCFGIAAACTAVAVGIGFLMSYIGQIAKPLLELAGILAVVAGVFGAAAMGISMHIDRVGEIGLWTAGGLMICGLVYLCVRLKLGERAKLKVANEKQKVITEAKNAVEQEYNSLQQKASQAIDAEKAKLKAILRVAVSDVPGEHGTLDLTKMDDWAHIGSSLGHEAKQELLQEAQSVGIPVPK